MRPYGESDRVVADGVDVVLLTGGLRSNGPAPVGEQHIVAQGGGGELRLAEQLDGTAHRVGVGGLPFLHRFEQVGEQRGELLHLHGVPLDDDAIAPHGEPSVEGLLQHVENLVGGTDDEGHVHPAGHRERCLHQISHAGYCNLSCAICCAPAPKLPSMSQPNPIGTRPLARFNQN